MITERWFIFWDLISVFSLVVPASTWRMMISYSSLVKNGVASVRGEASGIFHDLPPRIFSPAICPFLTIAPYRGAKQYASQPVHGEGDMHRTLCIELSVWSIFDHLWEIFSGELLGDDVISWPCSFRQWINTFRDLGALNLWTFIIGVEVPKNVYNSCPLKHEVVNLFWCRVKCFTMRIQSFSELGGDL